MTDCSILNFIHIPKTAGTSLRSVLEDHFNLSDIFPHYSDQDVIAAPERIQSYKLVRTHLRGLAQAADARGYRVDHITMLRHPVEQAISEFYHNQRFPDPLYFGSYELARLQTASPWEFLQEFPDRLSDNHQTYLLAQQVLGPQELEVVGTWPDVSRLAGQVLRSTRWFGIVEHFLLSMLTLHLEFGWRPVNLARLENIRPEYQRTALAPEAQASIAARQAMDMALYEQARSLFFARLEQSLEREAELRDRVDGALWDWYWGLPGSTEDLSDAADPVLAQRLHALASAQYLLTAAAAIAGGNRYAAASASSYWMDAADALSGAGWQRREYAPGVRPFRWSGPDRYSDIDLPVLFPRGGVLCLAVLCWHADEVLYGLKVAANGVACPHEMFFPRGDGARILVHVPPLADPRGAGFTRISFTVPSVARLCDFLEGGEDDRLVGFAFRTLEARPTRD